MPTTRFKFSDASLWIIIEFFFLFSFEIQKHHYINIVFNKYVEKKNSIKTSAFKVMYNIFSKYDQLNGNYYSGK